MKTSILKNVIFAMVLIPSIALAQLTKDHVHAPFNPMVLEYTLNHFNLKGNVAKIVEGSSEEGLITTTIFKEGKIIEKISLGEWDTTETYDYSYPEKIVIRQNDTITRTYFLKDGKITSFATEDGYKATISYDKDGHVERLKNTDTGKVISYNVYDTNGRLQLNEYFDQSGSTEGVDTYTYGTEGEYLTALSETFDPEVEEQMPSHMWVDKHGFIFFDEHPSDYKFTYDAEGNWVQYIFNGGKVSIKRTITYK